MRLPSSSALALAVVFVASLASLGCKKDATDIKKNDGGTAPLASASASAAATKNVADAAPPPPLDPAALAERGKALYGKYCDFCHGKSGEGYAADEAPKLASEAFLGAASDEFLKRTVARGRPGTTMSAWGVMGGGPLKDEDVAAVVAFIRSWQKTPPEKPLVDTLREAPAPDAGAAPAAARGAKIYGAQCETCHGKNGHDGKHNALGNAELLAAASDAFLRTAIEGGRPGTPMQAWKGKLASADVDAVIELLRSWQKPTEEITTFPPKPGALAHVVMNPGGSAPEFDAKADFIPVDKVKVELEKKASMIIIDARAPSDYVRAHVAGAISVPFYQVKDYAPQIPKDKWILTYCACPHAASVKARDALRGLGYTKVAVLDEGVLVWRDRGNPMRGGAKP